MKRHIGLLLSAIVLSLTALFFVLMAVPMVFAGIFADHHPPIAATITVTPHFFIYLMLAVAVFYATLAAWTTLTVIGILRLRSWARYSILILGGGITFFSLFAGVCTLLMGSKHLSPTAQRRPAHPLHRLFLHYCLLRSAAAVGVWWLVYFNLQPYPRTLFDHQIANPFFGCPRRNPGSRPHAHQNHRWFPSFRCGLFSALPLSPLSRILVGIYRSSRRRPYPLPALRRSRVLCWIRPSTPQRTRPSPDHGVPHPRRLPRGPGRLALVSVLIANLHRSSHPFDTVDARTDPSPGHLQLALIVFLLHHGPDPSRIRLLAPPPPSHPFQAPAPPSEPILEA
jgi:hypothetical protein